MSLTSASGRIVRVLCALLCGSAVFASPADRRTSAYYAHLDLTSTFDYYDNSWLKSEHHHQSPAAAPTWTPLEATIAGGNRSPETDEISAVPAAGTATLDLDVSYEYDLRGDRKVKNDASGTTNDATYDYDLDDRLTAETRGGPGGVGITYGYAKRGDLTTKTVGSATTTYLTDHMGRITALLGGGEHWHYTYAPTGDRFSKEDITVPGSGDMEVYLSSDGDTLIDYTKTGTGTLVFSGIYASPGVDGRVSRVNDLGETSYYFGDALQSVHQVTDATGFEIRRQFTDAWGNEIAGVGFGTTGPGDRYGFQGRESDSESGLQHFRARSYDPMTGRFTSRDPVPHSNLYHFVENNPVNATDPSGLDSIIEEGTKVSWQFVKDGITVSIPLGSKQNNGNVKMFGGFARTNIDISELTGRARDTDAGKYADSYAAINIALGGHVEKAESADLAGWDKGVAVAGRAGARLEQAATGAVLSVGTGGVGGAAGGGYMFMRGVSGYLGEWDPSWDFVRLAYEKDLGEAAPYVDFTADVVSGAMAGGGLADEPPLNVLTPRPRSLKVTLPEAYGPPKPGQYSTAFEVQLKATDLGRSRSVHFGRSNEALEAAMDADPALARTMEDMIPGVRAAIGSVGGRATPSGWIWHHATRAEAQGRAGVMRLVPEAQHEPQSVFWRILHPDKGARGGYSEWAIPAGAPKN